MKKFWLILLSLGLVMAFSVSALAADVKFSGEYYAANAYLNHVNVADPAASYSRSTDFFYQRLRLGMDFVVSPCLKLVTRMDIMERVWEPDSVTSYSPAVYDKELPIYTKIGDGNGDARNLDFDIAYIDYASPIGLIQVGFMPDYMWGTIWGNRTTGPTAGQIKYFLPIGPVTLVAAYAKEKENSYSIQNSTLPTFKSVSDLDYDSYRVGGIVNFKGNNFSGEAGLLMIYNHDATTRLSNYVLNAGVAQPFFKAKLGPVALQGEVNYYFGKYRDYDNATPDLDVDSWSAFLDGDVNIKGIVSVGFSAAFVQGDDNAADDTVHNALTGGRDWDPCLIMFNNTTANTWLGAIVNPTIGTIGAAGISGEMRNAYFGQLRAGVTPIPKLSFNTSVSYAAAHEKPAPNWERDYGWEIDVTGTYRITNNLSYLLGGAYLFTGDYFQAGNPHQDLNDDYLIINKLTLNF